MNTLEVNVQRFLNACPPNFDYPLGGDTPIPLPEEQELVNYRLEGGVITSTLVEDMRKTLSQVDAYSLAIFALRMAVLAVERNDRRLLEAGFWALLVDNDQLDWRDVIVSLSIVEDCLCRVGGDMNSLIDAYINLATERRRNTLIDGYLRRSSDMRHVETMGYKAVQRADGSLRYFKCL